MIDGAEELESHLVLRDGGGALVVEVVQIVEGERLESIEALPVNVEDRSEARRELAWVGSGC